MATAQPVREQLHDTISRLVHRGLGVEDYWRAVSDALEGVVPSQGTCLMTMDPATMLPTAEFVENGMPADAISRLVEIELREPDYTKWVDLARTGRTVASLSDVTAGELDLSRRHREVRRPGGYSDELRVILSSSTGTWGALTVFREKGRPYFSSAEVRLVTSLTGLISDGLRRALLLDDACAGRHDTGMLVLAPDDGVDLANQVAEEWIDELGTSTRAGTTLPLVIRAVARQARAIGARKEGQVGGASARPASARVRTTAGRWVMVRASLLGEGATAPVAVLLEAVRPAEMAPLLADVYGLTPQERRVTEGVAQGLPTRQIANQLRMSAYTVQDHLKSIFAKTGTGSRGDLVARLFFDQRAMRLTAPPTVPDESRCPLDTHPQRGC
ncbi:helix-turn-helix transcriptional regulator [Amycolatopsis magusensis]|uniref:DNA-binding CsgD family transcriptional regulator n=1 Tax=Amycolatopsis magusensis TaxID=882444 RepID=A0ABS4PTN2_9PSEU|nr:helix-turn-helix transcriptional regulator [Amycolatopsis magusensis]MBP2182789.1 DNA-binding CsgD family transcriptional regulator [Amycolatopsis magusensis]